MIYINSSNLKMAELFQDSIPSKKQRTKLVELIEKGVQPTEPSIVIDIRGNLQKQHQLISAILQTIRLISLRHARHYTASAHVPLILSTRTFSHYSKCGYIIFTTVKPKKSLLKDHTVLKIECCKEEIDTLSIALERL